ncbi:MAG: response regulator transcription factor [Anaerolineales bacterium]|jgi:two-component system response regulator NreC
MTQKIRIFLADDHAVLRTGLKMFINSQPDMICVGEAGDGASTLELARSLRPDLLLLDLSMPGLGGLDTLPEICRQIPTTRVLVLTMHTEEDYLHQALSQGAVGYVLKQAVDQELLSAIRAAMRGEIYIHPAMTRALLDQMISPTQQPDERMEASLSEREREVLLWVARGYTNQEISNQLALSVKTVETYRSRATSKLGLKSRAALVRYAQQRGWLNEP